MHTKRKRIAGYIASVSAALYGLPHLWWGLGIPFLFPGDFQSAPKEFLTWLIGYCGLGGLALLASVFGLAFARPWGERLPQWLLIVPAWVASVGMTLWGLGFFYLVYFFAIGRLQSTPQFAAQDKYMLAGYYWYTIFLIWGLSLGFAAFHAQKSLKTSSTSSLMDANSAFVNSN
jgi:hypothetical protein